jgi:hypothetical protein
MMGVRAQMSANQKSEDPTGMTPVVVRNLGVLKKLNVLLGILSLTVFPMLFKFCLGGIIHAKTHHDVECTEKKAALGLVFACLFSFVISMAGWGVCSSLIKAQKLRPDELIEQNSCALKTSLLVNTFLSIPATSLFGVFGVAMIFDIRAGQSLHAVGYLACICAALLVFINAGVFVVARSWHLYGMVHELVVGLFIAVCVLYCMAGALIASVAVFAFRHSTVLWENEEITLSNDNIDNTAIYGMMAVGVFAMVVAFVGFLGTSAKTIKRAKINIVIVLAALSIALPVQVGMAGAVLHRGDRGGALDSTVDQHCTSIMRLVKASWYERFAACQKYAPKRSYVVNQAGEPIVLGKAVTDANMPTVQQVVGVGRFNISCDFGSTKVFAWEYMLEEAKLEEANKDSGSWTYQSHQSNAYGCLNERACCGELKQLMRQRSIFVGMCGLWFALLPALGIACCWYILKFVLLEGEDKEWLLQQLAGAGDQSAAAAGRFQNNLSTITEQEEHGGSREEEASKKSTRGSSRLRSASSSAQRAAQTQQKRQGAKQAQRVKAVRHTLLGTAIVDRQAVVELVPLSGHNLKFLLLLLTILILSAFCAPLSTIYSQRAAVVGMAEGGGDLHITGVGADSLPAVGSAEALLIQPPGGTDTPTATPTFTPTPAPTASPTASPTVTSIAPTSAPTKSVCNNGGLNSGETDIDCGGICKPIVCITGKKCQNDDDCESTDECQALEGDASVSRCREKPISTSSEFPTAAPTPVPTASPTALPTAQPTRELEGDVPKGGIVVELRWVGRTDDFTAHVNFAATNRKRTSGDTEFSVTRCEASFPLRPACGRVEVQKPTTRAIDSSAEGVVSQRVVFNEFAAGISYTFFVENIGKRVRTERCEMSATVWTADRQLEVFNAPPPPNITLSDYNHGYAEFQKGGWKGEGYHPRSQFARLFCIDTTNYLTGDSGRPTPKLRGRGVALGEPLRGGYFFDRIGAANVALGNSCRPPEVGGIEASCAEPGAQGFHCSRSITGGFFKCPGGYSEFQTCPLGLSCLPRRADSSGNPLDVDENSTDSQNSVFCETRTYYPTASPSAAPTAAQTAAPTNSTNSTRT